MLASMTYTLRLFAALLLLPRTPGCSITEALRCNCCLLHRYLAASIQQAGTPPHNSEPEQIIRRK